MAHASPKPRESFYRRTPVQPDLRTPHMLGVVKYSLRGERKEVGR